jgi:hypothetical protein
MGKIEITPEGVATGPINTSQGIRYIKMSKTDNEGNDKSGQLRTAQTITLSYSDGEPAGVYPILNRVEENTYFTFTIDNVNYNTAITASNSVYTTYNYGVDVISPSSLIPYTPVNTSGGHVYNVYFDPFTTSSLAVLDNNGPDQLPYWKTFEGVNQNPNRFYWGDTPSIPMEYTASFAFRNTDGEAATRRIHAAIYKVKAEDTFAPALGTSNNFGSPQYFTSLNLVNSNVKINGGNSLGILPEGTIGNILPTATEYETGSISSEPFSHPIFPGWRVITITGVGDAVAGDAIGVSLKITSTIDGQITNFPDPSVVELSSLQFNINPHNIIGFNGNNPNSRIIDDPSSGALGAALFGPNINTNDPFVYNEEPYEFSVNNPIANNVDLYENATYWQRSLRNKTSINPFNIEAIIANRAEPANVKDYNYILGTHINARYKGAKNTSADFNLNSKKGLGLPPAEQRTNIFLNCLGAGGQTPEVKDATAFFFNKVIDERLDVYPSPESEIPQFKDVHYAFSPGTKANVNISPKNNKFIAYDGLSGQHNIIGIGKLQTLITTGQGINPWNYVDRAEFEGSDVENFQDFYYKKIFAQASTALGATGGILRGYRNSPWVKEAPSDGALQGTNEITAVGESSIDFSSTTDWMTVPFPDEVISVNPNSSADAGYVWNNTEYSFDFDISDSGTSPEVQFQSELPILWLGHAGYRYGGETNGNNEWQGNEENPSENVIGNSNSIFNPFVINVKLEVRLRLIKGNGDEENVEVINWPNSTTEYTNNSNNNVLQIERGMFGNIGMQNISALNGISPTETPIFIKSKPRTYQNGDILKVQVRYVSLGGASFDEGFATLLVSNTARARKLIKLIRVKNLTLDYNPPGQNNDTEVEFRPVVYDNNGVPAGAFVNSRTLNFENRYYFKALFQNPPPTDIVPIPSDNRWASLVENLGDTDHVIVDGLEIVCLSSTLTNMAVVKDTQILSGSQESFSAGDGTFTGYSKELLAPFDPQPGDQIRFAYNEDYTRTITKVFLPGEISGIGPGGDFENTRVYLILDQPLPALDEEVNHFIIRRFNKDNTQITMDVKKIPTPPNSPSGETDLSTITPIYLSEKLKGNFSQIIRKLSDEGIL